MLIKIPFVKMHGLGNDFVIINDENIPKDMVTEKLIKNISHRALGIGCDQLITYKQDFNKIYMSIYNQDGSRAKACGNATRCLTRLLFDEKDLNVIDIDVDGRIINGEYINSNLIKVNMGNPSFQESWMPNNSELWPLAERFMIEPKEMLCVDVGNPHLVIFSKLSDKDKHIIGKNFQNNNLFPDGINVNFAKIDDKLIKLKVWERGVGFTYACGSGAIATFAAANKLGFAENQAEIIFELGALQMEKSNEDIFMTGPASYVFRGDYIYEQ